MALGAKKLQIIILGDGAVGKTSILKMYAENKYTPSHITTIGKSLFIYIQNKK
jgi:GTPase SAR1 family protein